MANGNYSYPIDPSWTTTELETVIGLLNSVEAAYESGVTRSAILKSYREFKKIVPAKSEEMQLGRNFYAASGYQLYDVIKAAQNSKQNIIKLSRG